MVYFWIIIEVATTFIIYIDCWHHFDTSLWIILLVLKHCGSPTNIEAVFTGARLSLSNHVFLSIGVSLLQDFQDKFHMFKVHVFFHNSNLFFMHELIHIGALFYESGAEILALGWLERADYVENNCDEEVSLRNLTSLAGDAIYSCHKFIYVTLYCDDLQYGTWNVSYLLYLLDCSPECSLGSLSINLLCNLRIARSSTWDWLIEWLIDVLRLLLERGVEGYLVVFKLHDLLRWRRQMRFSHRILRYLRGLLLFLFFQFCFDHCGPNFHRVNFEHTF